MLPGFKSYAVAVLTAIVSILHAVGKIDDTLYQSLLGLLGAGAVAAVRAAINRIQTTPTRAR